jgi:hypothetical protein
MRRPEMDTDPRQDLVHVDNRGTQARVNKISLNLTYLEHLVHLLGTQHVLASASQITRAVTDASSTDDLAFTTSQFEDELALVFRLGLEDGEGRAFEGLAPVCERGLRGRGRNDDRFEESAEG